MLARQRAANLRDDPTAHFEFPWTVLAELNPDYRAFVAGEIRRLGEDHPIIKTQYRLETVDQAGRLFGPEQLVLLRGDHARAQEPDDGGEMFVAGVDVAGESEAGPDAAVRLASPRKDSTVITIARVSHPVNLVEPLIEVVQHHWWTGRDHSTQFSALLELLNARWRCVAVCVDGTGVGAGLASWLARAMPGRVDTVQFSRPAKSQIGYDLLAAANAGRLRMYRDDGSPEFAEFWQEVRACRYSVYQNVALNFFVDPADGHDDFVVSLGLCVRAAAQALPEPAGGIVTARRMYQDGRY